MGACSSGFKIWGWAVTRRTHLNGSTIPMQGPTPDAKLAAMELNGLASSVRQLFVKASPTVEKSCTMLRNGPTHSLVAKFPQRLVVACSTPNFVLQGKNAANEATDECVRYFDAWCRVAQWTYVPSDSLRENLAWWAVTQRTLKNHKTVKIGRWALARVWAFAQDNTVHVQLVRKRKALHI